MSTWARVVWSYPCPECGVGPGSNCRATSGAVKPEPHVARVREIVRCRRCGQWLEAEAADAGETYCPACLALPRSR